MATDILGKAVLDFHNKKSTTDIKTFSSLDEEDFIPLNYLFRNFKEMPLLEQKALQICKGNVLDIGCGAGSHSLYLQNKGFDVIALDYSEGAIEVCKERGLKKAICSDIYNYKDEKFDTLLLLMNGIGIVGKLEYINKFFNHLKTILKPNGQIILDSSDIIYMYEEDEDGGYWISDQNTYYGEVTFTMQYKDEKGDEFDWLYLDYNTLQRAAIANNFNCEMLKEGEHYDYLAKLTLNLQ
ncbi:class I SAM-dependent methyltransferase [Cellulophaga sp. HaHaR_3_176]|uniref:class I SAM-dependent methyltransferase n=1 Tax=Cellulophaga sp. HaHaR_3_176 TaxID=1942464 RepID=UPI001C1F2476|nr:class I SAM-dependent methyltransferase [Cellulophaga sp. HaHaR_3_176]QWX84326.1 class I SAM-dependent methyltransferase [Cellulophaga sp. HaHaR_3_176]